MSDGLRALMDGLTITARGSMARVRLPSSVTRAPAPTHSLLTLKISKYSDGIWVSIYLKVPLIS